MIIRAPRATRVVTADDFLQSLDSGTELLEQFKAGHLVPNLDDLQDLAPSEDYMLVALGLCSSAEPLETDEDDCPDVDHVHLRWILRPSVCADSEEIISLANEMVDFIGGCKLTQLGFDRYEFVLFHVALLELARQGEASKVNVFAWDSDHGAIAALLVEEWSRNDRKAASDELVRRAIDEGTESGNGDYMASGLLKAASILRDSREWKRLLNSESDHES